MKKLKHLYLPVAAVLFSAAALYLRRQLYAVALDSKGLLLSGHPLEAALWAVVLGGGILLTLAASRLGGANLYEENFRSSIPAFCGNAFMSATVLAMAMNQSLSMPGRIDLVWRFLGFLTAPGLLWAALCRSMGKKPFFGIHGALSAFLLLYLISRYQLWSSNPQLQDYVFELLAAAALTLFSYHCAAFEADTGSRRMQLATGMLSVLLCGAAVPYSGFPNLYLCGLIWAVTDLCALTPPMQKDEVAGHDPS
jgi:hypothetical protein